MNASISPNKESPLKTSKRLTGWWHAFVENNLVAYDPHDPQTVEGIKRVKAVAALTGLEEGKVDKIFGKMGVDVRDSVPVGRLSEVVKAVSAGEEMPVIYRPDGPLGVSLDARFVRHPGNLAKPLIIN